MMEPYWFTLRNTGAYVFDEHGEALYNQNRVFEGYLYFSIFGRS